MDRPVGRRRLVGGGPRDGALERRDEEDFFLVRRFSKFI